VRRNEVYDDLLRRQGHLGELVCQLRSFTAYDSPLLQGRCAAESVLGYTPDISPWVQHAWYEEVWYRDVDKVDKLGPWLGAATRHGGGDAFWILGKSCKPLVRSTVWSVTVKEKQTLEVQSLSEELHASVKSKIGDNRTDDDEVNQELEDIFPEPDEDLYLEDDTEEEEKTADRRSEADEYTPEAFDNYLNAEVMLPRGGENVKATIIKRSKNADGIVQTRFSTHESMW
jgi:hypothetical protein